MPPPPTETVASRFFLGPALRTQPDRRLVTLVRQGYESAFEEIVRRYGKPLIRYAAAIVGGRAEDVTQDAFSKALLALRRDEKEIELRPWLYRIVRNTALNDLRDRPAEAAELAEAIAGGRSPAEELEQREELTDLIKRLQELPEPQRAAIVMRELEGLSHDEIAAALGQSGGGARQAIYRARAALRTGLGLLLPLPLLRLLIDHGAEATAAGAGGVAVAGGVASIGGAGAGGALKLGIATALIAGSVGAGVALHERGDKQPTAAAAAEPVQLTRDAGAGASAASPAAPEAASFSLGRQTSGAGDGSQGRSGSGKGRSGSGTDNSGPGDRDGSGTFSPTHGPSHSQSSGPDFPEPGHHGGGAGPGASGLGSGHDGDGSGGGHGSSGSSGSSDGGDTDLHEDHSDSGPPPLSEPPPLNEDSHRSGDGSGSGSSDSSGSGSGLSGDPSPNGGGSVIPNP